MKDNYKKFGLSLMILALIFSSILPIATFANNDEPKIYGSPDEPTLTIHKYAQEKGETQQSGTGHPDESVIGTPLSGVEFTIKQTHTYDLATNEWTEVSGIEKTYTTGNDGQIVIENIDLGRYEFQETDGPDHVILNDETYHVDIPLTNEAGTELNYDVHVYPKNIVIRGDMEFLKVDATGAPLAGVVFELYEADGTPILDDTGAIVQLTTGDDGKISLIGLGQGTYYLKEVETLAGFALNDSKIEFTILPGSQDQVELHPIDGFVDESGTITNYQTPDITKDVEGGIEYTTEREEPYVYNITIDTPEDIDQYKVLGINDTLDERLSFTGDWEVSGTTKENIEFTEDGQTLKWYVKDFTTLTPGEPITVTFSAIINPDAELNPGEQGIPNEASLDFDNDRGEQSDKENPPTTPPVIVDPNDGGLKIIKIDGKDKKTRLEGAEFKLTTDAAGNDIIDTTDTVITVNGEKHTGSLENLRTTEYGTFTIDGLSSGTYYLHETKAPTFTIDNEEKSYELLTKPIKIKFKADQSSVKEVTVENIKPTEPSEPGIPGQPTDPDQPSKPKIIVPTTGGLGTIVYTLIGLSIIGLAIYLYVRRKKHEQQA